MNSDSSESSLSNEDVILTSVEKVHTPNCGRDNNSKKVSRDVHLMKLHRIKKKAANRVSVGKHIFTANDKSVY